MNWLHLTAGNLYGGIETYLSTMARNRDLAPGYSFGFGLCFEGRHAAELRAAGVPVHVLGVVRFSRPWSVIAARLTLRRVLSRERFDGVVCHGSWVHALFATVATAAGLPVVLHVHNSYRGRHWTERVANMRRPHGVIFNSRHCRDTSTLAWPGIRTEIVHCPVEAPPTSSSMRRQQLRTELATAPQAVVVMQAARMEAWKGHAATLTAFAFAAATTPDAVLWLAGGPQRPAEHRYLDELEALARDLGIAGQVRFLGDRRDVAALLAAADLYCQPNLEAEPFGISFVEALYAGLPVLAYDAGGPSEIVTVECGILVREHDENALADAFADLLQNPQRRAALAAAAPGRATALCDPAQQLQKQAHFLRSVLRA